MLSGTAASQHSLALRNRHGQNSRDFLLLPTPLPYDLVRSGPVLRVTDYISAVIRLDLLHGIAHSLSGFSGPLSPILVAAPQRRLRVCLQIQIACKLTFPISERRSILQSVSQSVKG